MESTNSAPGQGEGSRRRQNLVKGIAAIVASALGFAIMAMFVRLTDDFGQPISAFQKGFFRNAVAFAIALAAFMRTNREKSEDARPNFHRSSVWMLLLARSVLGTCGIFANFYALSHVPIADAQTLNKTAPFFTVAFAWLFFGERPSGRQAAALALAFCGVVLVAKPGFAGAAAFPLAMGLVGGACAGAAYAFLRTLRKHGMSPESIVLFFSAFSCLASIPFMAAGFDPMTWRQVAALLGAGAGAAMGQFGITIAYGYAAPRDIAVYDYSNILFTAALGFTFFGQVPDALSAVGFALVIAAALRLHGHH